MLVKDDKDFFRCYECSWWKSQQLRWKVRNSWRNAGNDGFYVACSWWQLTKCWKFRIITAGALASAASTIASAASTTAAQASAIKSITSGSYLSNSGSSKSGKKKTSKKTSSAPKVQTALPKNGKFFHNAKGSLVRGHIVSELGEEGNEMVIPLSRHRSRALSLWNQAGQILGVTKHAKGGLVGGSPDLEKLRLVAVSQ